MHRYRPKGLIPSAPASVVVPPVPLVEFEFESPFVVEAFLPGPESAVVWNVLEHAWHVGLEFAVSSTVIL